MQKKYIQPNVIAYSAGISACEKGQKFEKALELILDMQAKHIQPNGITYAVSIITCFRSGALHRALEVMKDFLHGHADHQTLISTKPMSECIGIFDWRGTSALQDYLVCLAQCEVTRLIDLNGSTLVSAGDPALNCSMVANDVLFSRIAE